MKLLKKIECKVTENQKLHKKRTTLGRDFFFRTAPPRMCSKGFGVFNNRYPVENGFERMQPLLVFLNCQLRMRNFHHDLQIEKKKHIANLKTSLVHSRANHETWKKFII